MRAPCVRKPRGTGSVRGSVRGSARASTPTGQASDGVTEGQKCPEPAGVSGEGCQSAPAPRGPRPTCRSRKAEHRPERARLAGPAAPSLQPRPRRDGGDPGLRPGLMSLCHLGPQRALPGWTPHGPSVRAATRLPREDELQGACPGARGGTWGHVGPAGKAGWASPGGLESALAVGQGREAGALTPRSPLPGPAPSRAASRISETAGRPHSLPGSRRCGSCPSPPSPGA